MDQEAVVHFTRGYHSDIKRNKSESVVVNWMNLKPLIQSKASQKEKKNHKEKSRHIYMESRKMVLMNLVENRLVDTVAEGEGGMT